MGNLPLLFLLNTYILFLYLPTTSLKSITLGLLLLILYLFGIVLYFVLFYSYSSEAIVNRMMLTILQMGSFLVGYSILQSSKLELRPIFIITTIIFSCTVLLTVVNGWSFGDRVSIPIIDYGRFFGLALLVFWFGFRKVKSFTSPIFLLGCLLTIIYSQTRQGLFVSILLIGVYEIFLSSKSVKSTFYIISFLILTIVFSSMFDLGRLTSMTSLSRLEQYALSYEMFLEKPFFGWGIGGFGEYLGFDGYYPHSQFLEVLSEFGIVGAIYLLLTPVFIVISQKYTTVQNVEIYLCLMYYVGISQVSYSLPHYLFSFLCISFVVRRFLIYGKKQSNSNWYRS
ncbi:O-antigen ligase family protein [Vibrio cyclitrophicus]|uniref:O-antigen ligase family protein n=1 Tax=Vibrio cyclitrophicus TaxID=47951 RepID=UPI0038A067EE